MMKNFRIEGQEIEPVKRRDLWITSKLWNDVHHDVVSSCEKSLTDFQLEWGKPIYQYVPTITAQKDFIKDYVNTLPENWDDVKFIDGFPGRFDILASTKGGGWCI
jgi:diketogulonate reductase-like aldo/keto reductase